MLKRSWLSYRANGTLAKKAEGSDIKSKAFGSIMTSENAKSESGRVWNTGHWGHTELYLSC